MLFRSGALAVVLRQDGLGEVHLQERRARLELHRLGVRRLGLLGVAALEVDLPLQLVEVGIGGILLLFSR